MDPDRLIQEAPEAPAVFAIFADQGAPYLARTTRLRTRLARLLGSKWRYTLRDVARRIEVRQTASALDAALTHYEWAKRFFPEDWQRRLRLRYPAFVRFTVNPFPRVVVRSKFATSGLSFGPFRTRASAEAFEAKLLDLFQVRRCVEDLAPSPEHPGCIYGEMNLCLRPCQEAVSVSEYAHEVARAETFLRSSGQSLVESIAAARDRASEAMEFEEAERMHARLEKIEQTLRLRDELAVPSTSFCGVAVNRSLHDGAVELRMFANGFWQPAIEFKPESAGHSIDARLRELTPSSPWQGTQAERNEHTAILSAWYYSSSRDGEWLSAPSLDKLPYRKLVNAISRVLRGVKPPDAPSSATPPSAP